MVQKERQVAVDGDGRRGGMTAVDSKLGMTAALRTGDARGNGDAIVRDALEGLDLEGRVIIVSPLLARPEVAQIILDGGGDYVMLLGGGQRQLLHAIRHVFQAPEAAPSEMATEVSTRRDDRIEACRLRVCRALVDHSGWPGLEQVFEIERTVICPGTGEGLRKVAYGVTSLSPQRGDPARLLQLLTTPLA